ncbi:MAG: hypothetical protein C4527_21500 [Candidatus Omnitrophota bacterium]|jgi:hypothetical protein|nr:MAG: hypothetical protein C4527_21500 [Candidatus Omnitrophota bacterium]
MPDGRRWEVRERYGNLIYLTYERWQHIIDPMNHPEMSEYEACLKETVRLGKRKQDSLDPRKFRYAMPFNRLYEFNTHIIAIVLFRFTESPNGVFLPNNYIVTAYQKVIE